MGLIKAFLNNKWVGFTLASLVYILWFVVWTENAWMLLGEIVIFDAYITKFFSRKVWRYNRELVERFTIYRTVYEWVNAILFATVFATLIHIFVFQMYVIPTSSMEHSLLVGDYLCVSKVAYGPQMPNTPLSFPFVHHTMPFSQTKKSFSEAIYWDYHRLKGLRQIQHNDVVVFNFPAGDTVLLENQGVTYYDVVRQYEDTYGRNGRKQLAKDYTIISRPVDKRENYIKRCVALPGDSLEIREGVAYINSKPQQEVEGVQYLYDVKTMKSLSKRVFDNLEISEVLGGGLHFQVYTTPENAEALRQLKSVESVVKYVSPATREMFPHWVEARWSVDNYGPIWIPRKGATTPLTLENLPFYRRIIEAYEGHDLEVKDDHIFIDGKEAHTYTFAMDYYWMMGDNRHNSADSRYWGFVPEDHIVGRASFVWLSLDKDKSFPQNIRWNRMFSKVK